MKRFESWTIASARKDREDNTKQIHFDVDEWLQPKNTSSVTADLVYQGVKGVHGNCDAKYSIKYGSQHKKGNHERIQVRPTRIMLASHNAGVMCVFEWKKTCKGDLRRLQAIWKRKLKKIAATGSLVEL